MTTADLRAIYGSVRTHQKRTYVLHAHSLEREPLDYVAGFIPGALVTWEAEGVVSAEQTQLGPRFALWVPAPDTSPDEVAPSEDSVTTEADEEAPSGRRKRGPKTTKYKNITRIDHPAKRTHGYFVRVRWKNERRSKFFSDRVHGDRLAALAAAIEWRNATEEELGKPRTERLVIGATRAQTGVQGIRRRIEGHTAYYEATWVGADGRQHRSRYSIAKHGERRALQKALRARNRGERERLMSPAPERT